MITLTPKAYASWIPLGQIFIYPSIYAVAILPAGRNEKISIGTERRVAAEQGSAGETERIVGSGNKATGDLAREVKTANNLSTDTVRCVYAAQLKSNDVRRQIARSEEAAAGTSRKLYADNLLVADTRRIVADGIIYFKPSVFASWIPLGKIIYRPALYASLILPTEWRVSLSLDTARRIASPADISGETERKVTRKNIAVGDTRRTVFSPYIAFTGAGTKRAVQKSARIAGDTGRLTSEDFAVVRADTSRLTSSAFAVSRADSNRELKRYENLLFNTKRRPAMAAAALADTSRTPGLLNTVSFSLRREVIKQENISFDTSIRVPVVLEYTVAAPSARMTAKAKAGARTAVPALIENFRENGVRSFSVSLNELSLSDTFQLETSRPLEIDDAVQGRLLDYDFSFHVEETSQRNLMQTVKGMYDQDAILYTAISIFVEEANVSYYAQEIARALGLKLHRRCDDFIPSQDFEDSGMTYKDFLASLFGWTAKLPQRQINVFIRGDTLHIIQRGLEEEVIDVTDWPYERPTIERKLVRSIWHKSKGGDDGSARSDDDKPIPFNGTISLGEISRTYVDGYLVRETNESGVTEYIYSPLDSSSDKYLSVKETRNYDKSASMTQYAYARTGRDVYLFLEYERTTGANYDPYDWQHIKDEDCTVRKTYHSPLGYGWYGTTVYVDGVLEGSSLSQGKPGGKASQFTIDQSNLALGSHYSSSVGNGESYVNFSSLIDTSFPVKGDEYLWILTRAIEWLNRKTQETISLVIQSPVKNGVPEVTHVIDFTERIRFRGNEYFLISNNVELTPRTLKQSIKMVRWY